MNAENGTRIQKWCSIYSLKKREIRPSSFIFSNLAKLPPLIFSKITTLRNMFVQKPRIIPPPSQNQVAVNYRNKTRSKT